MSNVDTTKFSAYLDAFHRTYVETVVEHVPAPMRGFLERFSRLPCRVIGYVSTNFGVAFEYVPGPEEITVDHSSSRIEDFFLGAPSSVRNLPTMILFEGSGGLRSLTLEGGFPFRFRDDAIGGLTLADVAFKASGWTRTVEYAELFPIRAEDQWTEAKAVERAKDEVLRALADIRLMEAENASLGDFLAGQKQRSVLIAGDFSTEGRGRLDAIRRAVRELNYLPRLLDEVPDDFDYDLPEKFAAVATMARFIVIDDSSPSGHIREFADAAQRGLLTIVLRLEGSTPSYMTAADKLKSTVLREFTYSSPDALPGVLYEATQWAEARLSELREERADLYPWRTDAA